MLADARGVAGAANAADVRAWGTEEQMTDEERFSLLAGVVGTNPVCPRRDKRISEAVPKAVACARRATPLRPGRAE
jgi:hypothetical protein